MIVVNTNRREIYEKAIGRWGINLQMDVAIEEMAELTKEIVKGKRGSENADEIIEEVADVYIMLEQIITILHCEEEVNQHIQAKVNRLKATLEMLQ